MTLTLDCWVAIRTSDVHDWIDVGSISTTDMADAESKARTTNKRIPTWAKSNPIKYFAKALITLKKE